VVALRHDLDPARIRERLEAARAQVGEGVELLVAVKYVPEEELVALAEAGVTLVGENRTDQLAAKQDLHGDAFARWDFIGHLQSRKVKELAGRVELIHSVHTDSVVRQLATHLPGQGVLVEVNVAREEGKDGLAPEELDPFLERCAEAGLAVRGLMTMPPLAPEPEASRPHFAALAQLAADRGLPELSMGTSQDFAVAAQEGATVVRLGSSLFD
jgi:PLP dependent protein